MATNKDGTTRKTGSGRKKGAVSFVKIPLKQLNGLLREDMQVVVSRRFAESLGLGGEMVKGTPKNVLAPTNPVEVKVEQPVPLSVQEDW